MTSDLRVLLYHRTEDLAGIEAAYHLASRSLAGAPGMAGNELLRSVHNPCEFLVMSSWHDFETFSRWEQGPDHKLQTASLRRFRDNQNGRPFGIYRVMSSY